MTADDPQVLVSATWLRARLRSPGLVILDGSWHMPASGRDAAADFAQAHIPGARFFDIDRMCDRASPLPHMLPDAGTFARQVAGLGVSNSDQIIVYDTVGIFSAARVWWMFKAMGHAPVAVLDGGLPAWQRAGGDMDSGPARPAAGRFSAALDRRLRATCADVKAALAAGTTAIVDARPAARFNGEAPEPRPGLAMGHNAGGHQHSVYGCH